MISPLEDGFTLDTAGTFENIKVFGWRRRVGAE